MLAVDDFVRQGKATAYDRVVAEGLADVLTGGPEADPVEPLPEDKISRARAPDHHAPAAPAPDAGPHGAHAGHRQAAAGIEEGPTMPAYQAPLRDMRFVLDELHGRGDLAKLPGYQEATPDLFAERARSGRHLHDREAAAAQPQRRRGGLPFRERRGAHARGFKEAYNEFAEGGWISLAADPAYGGQGLPPARQYRGRGDDLLDQSLLRHVSRA